jgi:hypothetical protein
VKHPPRLPDVLDEQPLTDHDLEAGARIADRRLDAPQLAQAELRGCDLDGLHGIGRLDGIAMPWPDIVDAAGTFASALGVRVAED